MSNGYIKIWRKIKTDKDWQQKRVFSRFEAWIDMLLRANGIEKTIMTKRNGAIQVKRGSFITSERELADAWGWSRERVRRYLKTRQGSASIVLQKRYHRYTYITIVKYNTYNPFKTTDETTEKPQKNHRRDPTNEREIKENESELSISYDILVEKWNDFAQKYRLSKIDGIKTSSTRQRHLKARTKERGFSFDGLLQKIEEQPFLLGKNKNNWKVTFDWIILPSNYQKIIEENYKTDSFSGIRGFYEEQRKKRNNETKRP